MQSNFRPGLTLTARPHPRVAVFLDDTDERAALVRTLSGLVENVREVVHEAEVNWTEFDCVFTERCPVKFVSRRATNAGWQSEDQPVLHSWQQAFPNHLDVFTFFGSPDDVSEPGIVAVLPESAHETVERPYEVVRARAYVVGEHISRVNGLEEAVSDAVDISLTPAAKARTEHVTYTHAFLNGSNKTQALTFRPLLLGPDDAPLAITYTRPSGASVWVLPTDSSNVVAIIRAAFAEWHARDPKRYPALPDWDGDEAYMTASERKIVQEIDELEQERADQESVFQQKRALLEASLREASEDANRRSRALLRSDGEVLEAAVGDALETLGFSVRRMDEVNVDSKREDFRISDSDAPEWEAIAEAKGYKGGAKVEAFRQVDAHAMLYARETGKIPAKWIIVNAQRMQDPSSRESPYATRHDDIGRLEESGDLVLDTRALFDFVRQVEEDASRAPKVREFLRDKTGVLATAPEIGEGTQA